MKNRCIVVSGGELISTNFQQLDDDFVICADSGYDNAMKLGLKVDVVIGDFDSISNHSAIDCKKIQYDTDKDDTDSLLCLKYAGKLGYKKILLICAMGGYIDHLWANVQSMLCVKKLGIDVTMIDQKHEISVLCDNQSICLNGETGQVFSLIALSNTCYGVSITGAKYNLHKQNISNSYPFCVRNQLQKDSASISVENGNLLVILTDEIKTP